MLSVYSLFHIDLNWQTILLGPLFGNAFESVSFGIEFDIESFRDIDGFSLRQSLNISLVQRAGVNKSALLSFTIKMRVSVTRCNFPSGYLYEVALLFLFYYKTF